MIRLDNSVRHKLACLAITCSNSGVSSLVIDEDEMPMEPGVKVAANPPIPPVTMYPITIANAVGLKKLPFIGPTRGPTPLPFDMTLKRRRRR